MKITLLFIAIILLIAACCRNPVTYKLPEDFKKYILFPKGSQWIYKDQNNNLDTLRLNSIANGISENNCEMVEGIGAHYSSTRLGDFNTYSTMFVPNVFYYCCDGLDKKYFLDLNSDTTQNPYLSCHYAAHWHIELSMVVENRTYNEVLVVIADTLYGSFEGYSPIESYFVKNIGLIQVKHFDGSEWKLNEFFINNKP